MQCIVDQGPGVSCALILVHRTCFYLGPDSATEKSGEVPLKEAMMAKHPIAKPQNI